MKVALRHGLRLIAMIALILGTSHLAAAMGPMSAAQKNQNPAMAEKSDETVVTPHHHIRHHRRHHIG